MNSEEKVGKGTQDTELNALKEVLRVNDKFVKSKRKGEMPGIEASTRKWKEVSSHLSPLTSHLLPLTSYLSPLT